MRNCWRFEAALGLALITSSAYGQQAPGIAGVVAAGTPIELVQEGFTFLEGPVGMADGTLVFSDPRVSKTYRLDGSGKITVIRENTNGTNGLALDKNGDLINAE